MVTRLHFYLKILLFRTEMDAEKPISRQENIRQVLSNEI